MTCFLTKDYRAHACYVFNVCMFILFKNDSTCHYLRKELLSQARTIKSKLQHVWHWKELPNGDTLTVRSFDEMMSEAGKMAESLDEGLAGVKGQLNARAMRAKANKK